MKKISDRAKTGKNAYTIIDIVFSEGLKKIFWADGGRISYKEQDFSKIKLLKDKEIFSSKFKSWWDKLPQGEANEWKQKIIK